MQVRFARHSRIAVVFCIGILCAATENARAQTIAPNFVECTLTAQGVMSCATFNGAACSGPTAYSKTCSIGGTSATCSEDKLGTVTCTRVTNSACYKESGTAKCYVQVPQGPPPRISSSPASVQLAQYVNTTSAQQPVTFTTSGASGTYAINGFLITGDFKVVSTQGACTTGSANSSCTVNVTGTPVLPGQRYGTLSMVTSIGTVAVSFVLTGSGLPAPTVDNKNAGFNKSLRAVLPTPGAIVGATQRPLGRGRLAVASSATPGAPTRSALGTVKAADFGLSDDGGGSQDPCSPATPTPPTPPTPPDDTLTPPDDTPAPPDDAPTPFDETPSDSCANDSCDPGGEIPPPEGGGGSGLCKEGICPDVEWVDAEPVDLKESPEYDISSSVVAFVADPVNAANGNKVHVQTDFSSSFPNPLSFVRTYNSYGWTSLGIVRQSIGIGWRSNWDRLIIQNANGTATVIRSDGKSYTFLYQPMTQTWTGSPDVAAALSQTTDVNGYAVGWTMTLPNGDVEKYDAIGRLIGVIPFAGPSATYALAYDAQGRLQTVSNGAGRQLGFTYDFNNRVATMIDSAAGVSTYGYDASNRLTRVTYADGRTRGYAYQNTLWPFAMTSIIDGTGNTFVTFTYNNSGRMNSSQFAGAVGGGSISYGSNSATFTNAVGAARLLHVRGQSGRIATDIQHGILLGLRYPAGDTHL